MSIQFVCLTIGPLNTVNVDFNRLYISFSYRENKTLLKVNLVILCRIPRRLIIVYILTKKTYEALIL